MRAGAEGEGAPDGAEDEARGGLVALAALSLVVGAATGLLAALFRLALERAEALRDTLVAHAHGRSLLGFLLVLAGASAAAALAAWLVRRFSPAATGSGIPQVEAVLHGEVPPAPLVLLPVKFVGGLLAIGSGLALGREGPSVQMGAGLAVLVARLSRRAWADTRVLLAAGAGAGLATAFNAPMAGAAFVLEELVRRFEPRIAIAALGASATAIPVARILLGEAPDFQVPALSAATAETRPLFFLLGAAAGLLAVAYNKTLLATLEAAERMRRLPVEARAAAIGAAVGALAWFAPRLVGGGDALTQSALTGADPLAWVAASLVLRFALGAASYAAATPGGLFAPMLVLGAQGGLLFGAACQALFPALALQREAFALVGMAAFFAGVVRAPLTGLVLVSEMTGDVTLLLPMLGASFLAMLVPTLLRDPPIYDSLRARSLLRR